MNKPKVIHVLYSGLGGHGNVVFSLMETQFREDFEHILVFYGVEKVRQEYLDKAKEIGIKTYSILKKPKRYLKSFKNFKQILVIEAPKSIIVHNSELLFPALSYKKKNKACTTFYVEHQTNHAKPFLLRVLTRKALKHATNVVCLSENYKTELVQVHGFENKIVVIPNGINTEKYVPTNAPSEEKFIGMAARITSIKDHFNLIKAFKQIVKTNPSWQLKIAGTGDQLEKIKALVRSEKLGNHVHFLGLLGEEELISFYQSLTIYIHATKGETLSTSILQAMACELPIIASDITNNKPLIIPEETGWLYENENDTDLAIKINTVIKAIDIESNSGKLARKMVLDKYSNLLMAEKYRDLIERKSVQ